MRKITLIVFILIITSGISFAQRYHYEINEKITPRQKQPSKEQKSVPTKDTRRYYQPTTHYNVLPSEQYTESYSTFEINANSSDVEVILEHTWDEDERIFSTSVGTGLLYSDDEDYRIFNLKFTVGDRGFIFERLKFEMGFKGILGEMEKKHREGDVAALGFLGALVYDFPELEIFDMHMPIDSELSGSVCWAPSAISFDELDLYWEWKISYGLYLLERKQGFLFFGFRGIGAEFNNDSADWKKTDTDWFFGLRFMF